MKPINERLERIESEEQVTIPAADGTVRTLTVKVPAWRDPKDGEIYLDADAIALLDKTRARHLGVLAPQELARLRQRLGLTQRQIAALLQIGEKTWSRWETGREIPSRSLNLLLLALYEGKIDPGYLRSKQLTDTGPAPEPVLRAHGWEELARQQRKLVWLDNQVLAQEDWSLALKHSTEQLVTCTLWINTPFPLPPGSDRGSEPRPGALEFAGRTEKMPLSA